MKYMQIMHLFSNVIETNVKWGAVTASIRIVFTVSLLAFFCYATLSSINIFTQSWCNKECVEYAELTKSWSILQLVKQSEIREMHRNNENINFMTLNKKIKCQAGINE